MTRNRHEKGAVLLVQKRARSAIGTPLRLNKPKNGPSLHGPIQSSEPTEPRTVHPRNVLNDLTAPEWISETVSVWTQKGLGANSEEAKIERQHPAPFSFSDVSRLIRFFTKKSAIVLDPFVGVGSTLKACAIEHRSGIGIELNSRYARLARERLHLEARSAPTVKSQKIIRGDSRREVLKLPENSIDFVVTSPPYAAILHKEDHKVRQERTAHGLEYSSGSARAQKRGPSTTSTP